jgi:6-pyruvoyltetrahydropterin/6-carboxytetrahydropterin synthase
VPGIYEVFVTSQFAAAHRLKGYPGDCCRVHGHNWSVEVHVQCRELDPIGMGIDFREVKQSIAEVLGGLDHLDLNEVEPFRETNPTAENIARFLYKELRARLDSDRIKVSRVLVSETPGAGASYWEEA